MQVQAADCGRWWLARTPPFRQRLFQFDEKCGTHCSRANLERQSGRCAPGGRTSCNAKKATSLAPNCQPESRAPGENVGSSTALNPSLDLRVPNFFFAHRQFYAHRPGKSRPERPGPWNSRTPTRVRGLRTHLKTMIPIGYRIDGRNRIRTCDPLLVRQVL